MHDSSKINLSGFENTDLYSYLSISLYTEEAKKVMGYDPTEDYGAGLGKTWTYETQRLHDAANGDDTSFSKALIGMICFWTAPIIIFNLIYYFIE